MASSGDYIYKRLYDYYGGQQLPADNTGVFFSTPNFTRPRLIECIEYLQNNYGAGWLTDDQTQRRIPVFRQSCKEDRAVSFKIKVSSFKIIINI